MSFDLDRRLAAARKRVHDAIDSRHAAAVIHFHMEQARTLQWLQARANFHSRSSGQLRRFSRARYEESRT